MKLKGRKTLKTILCFVILICFISTSTACGSANTSKDPIHLDMLRFAGEKGLYHLDNKAFLKILDYSSGKNTFLCNKPECKHNDEKCYANSGAIMLFADSSYLYTITLGSSGFVLERRNLDGSGKSTFFELCKKYNFKNDAHASPNSGVLYDNKLYMTYNVTELNSDTGTEDYKGIITCIDFNNKTEIELTENKNSQFSIVNYIDGKLYYLEWHSNLKQMNLSDSNNTDCSLIALSLSDNSTEKLHSANQKEFYYSGSVDNRIIYYKDSNTENLYSITIPSGEIAAETYIKRYIDDKGRGDIVYSEEDKSYMLLKADGTLEDLPFGDKGYAGFSSDAGEGLLFLCGDSDIKGENCTIEKNKQFYISKDNFYGKKNIFFPAN